MKLPAWIKGTVLLAATFAGGVAAGIYYDRRHGPSAHATVRTDAHAAMHQLATDLDLDAAQQQAISEIFARHQQDIDAAWHAMQPNVRATLDSTHQEILKVLRPDQATQFRKMTETMHPPGHR